MAVPPISQTRPTDQNYSRYKGALDSKEQTFLDECPIYRDPMILANAGIGVCNLLFMIGVAKQGAPVEESLCVRFLALGQILDSAIDQREIHSMSHEQAAFLISLLRREERLPASPLEIESPDPYTLKTLLESIDNIPLNEETFKLYKEHIDILAAVLPGKKGFEHFEDHAFLNNFNNTVGGVLSHIEMYQPGESAHPQISIRFFSLEYLTRSSLTVELMEGLSEEQKAFLSRLLRGEN